MSQRKVQASGKFEAVEEEECGDHHSAAAAGGAGSRLAYNSSHTHPTTSNNYQQTQTDTQQKRETISTHLVTFDLIYFLGQRLSILDSLNREVQFYKFTQSRLGQQNNDKVTG